MDNAFRIQRVSRKPVQEMSETTSAEKTDDQPPNYAEKLVKLIPAEVVALYLAGQSTISTAFEADVQSSTFFTEPWAWGLWTLLCLVGLIFLRAHLTQGEGVGPEKPAIVISAVAFLLWVYAFGDVFQQEEIWGRNIHNSLLASLLLIAGNFFAPFLYNPDPIEV